VVKVELPAGAFEAAGPPGSPSGSEGGEMSPLLPEAVPGRPSQVSLCDEDGAEEAEEAPSSAGPAVKTEVREEVRKRQRGSVLDAARRSIAAQQKSKRQMQAVKREEPAQQGEPWDPIQHFKYQVALIHQLIPKPRKWESFYGGLGTGIIGVRPKHPPKDRPATAAPSTPGRVQPLAAGYVILFINASTARLQNWNGRTLAGYTPMFDLERRKLRWESQRNDHHGRVIARITEYVQQGSQVVVAVRGGPGEDFRILGRTQQFSLEAPSRFLLQEGDHILAERGSRRIHRHVLAQCLDGGLKSGVGLVPHIYPLPRTFANPLFCSACCRTRATASVLFDEVDEVAASLLAAPQPARRLRGKQTPGQAGVKRERAEEPRIRAAAIRRRWRRSLFARRPPAMGANPDVEPAAAEKPQRDPLLVERNALMARLSELDWELAIRATAGGS